MLAILGGAKWKRQTAREIELLSSRGESSRARVSRYDRAEISALPTPVRRYFDFVLTQGQPMVASACIEWTGKLSMRPHRWSAFSATQHYHVHPPGFVWDARVWMTGMVPVLVRDSYADHEGSMKAAIGGIVKVADASGTSEIAKGALLRYLGEAVWFPTALLPAAGVTWTALDHDSAAATLSDGPTTVSLDAHFGESGEIVSISAMRPREVAGSYISTPWVAHLRGYTRRHGMMVPTAGGVEWQLPSGPLPYWQGRVVRAAYDFAR
jgi:hypothetical protein